MLALISSLDVFRMQPSFIDSGGSSFFIIRGLKFDLVSRGIEARKGEV